MDDEDPLIPFDCGTQYMDWLSVNCHQCARYRESDTDVGFGNTLCDISRGCDIELAVFNCSWDEPLAPDMARRMGYILPDGSENKNYNWRCTEFAATQEVVDEERRRAEFAAHPVLPGMAPGG